MEEWRYNSTILDLITRRRRVVASRPGRFTPEEIVPGTHWIGGWVDSRADMDAVEKRQNLPLPEIEPGPSSP
jgi:hypothetical protein